MSRGRVAAALALALALAWGCGPRAAPAKPKVDTVRLARVLHEDLLALGMIAKRHRGSCPALITALRPHVETMRVHAAEVRRALEDPETATVLRRQVRTYDEQHRGVADAIGEDLGASYVTCKDNAELTGLIDRIPEL